MKALLQVSNIDKHYGGRTIFEQASAAFYDKQKIGVIGRNGAGKSTLCRMIIREEEPDRGVIDRSTDLRLAYLEQHDPFLADETVLEFLERRSGKPEWEIGRLAARFELGDDKLYAPVSLLSGGYKTRVKIAAMLLEEPNFLILDEPTNFLDLNTVILLEEFLREFPGGFLIVSHDREFLKRTCDHTLEVEDGDLTLFPGNVEDYLEFKEEQVAHAERHNRNVEAKKAQLQRFVDRFGAKASKATQARAKEKQISRLETIEIAHPTHGAVIKIPRIEARKGVALRCKELAIGYPDKIVADRVDLEVPRGARVAVLGENGQGKTTFLRTLAEDLPRRGGDFEWGYQLTAGYYAQHVYTALPRQNTVEEYLLGQASNATSQQDVLNLAGSFLFRGDDVRKPVSVLSGGERARLCLAGLLLRREPVLLLDEPTNHLDFETVEALGDALRRHNGTVFFVSHDRTFVHLVATHIVEVKDGAIRFYPGSYQEYVYHLEYLAQRAMEDAAPKKSAAGAKSGKGKHAEEADGGGDAWQRRKEIRSLQTKLATKLQKIEAKILQLNDEKQKIEKWFVANPSNWGEAAKKNERLAELVVQIEKKEEEWLLVNADKADIDKELAT